MKTLPAIVAILALVASPASAALLQYEMTFRDSGGAKIGFGNFSYDPDVKEDLYVDAQSGGDCEFYTIVCVLGATWTPLQSFYAEIYSVSVGYRVPAGYDSSVSLYAEGYYFWHGRYQVGGLDPGRWFVGDPYFGEFQLLMDTLAAAGADGVGKFDALGYFDPHDAQVRGTVEFSEIPLPAGLPLFLSGLLAAAISTQPKRLAKH